MGITVEQALLAGMEHHQAGRLAEAEQFYRIILQHQPDHAEALHRLGVLAHQVGLHETAIDLLSRAARACPGSAMVWNNLGEALRCAGRPADATGCYREALRLAPSNVAIKVNLALALKGARKLEEAAAELHQVIAQEPEDAEAHLALGNTLRELGEDERSMGCYKRAVELAPRNAEAHGNLAVLLEEQRQYEDALLHARRAVEMQPCRAAFHYNLGNVHLGMHQWEEAAAAYRQVLAIDGQHAPARGNLGTAMMQLGRHTEAIEQFRMAAMLQPTVPEYAHALGEACRSAGRVSEAMECFRRAVELRPDSRWHDGLLLAMHYTSEATPQAIHAEHAAWAKRYAEPLHPVTRTHDHDRDPHRRLRIGYVSADFREHSVAYFIEGALSAADHERFEVFCYSGSDREDGTTERIRRFADHWRPTADLDDGALTDRIESDRIDILVDLSGHTAGNRLLVFARKPAPVQATYLGYPDTTGLTTIDYRLTDVHADPPGLTEPLHTESLFRLPDCFLCYRPPVECPAVGEPPASSRGHVTFGSFNALMKIGPELLDLWGRILLDVPGSHLLLKNAGLADPAVCASVVSRLSAMGIDPARVELLPRAISMGEHMATYDRVDIALDTHPYCGTTTTCEAMWMGAPVVTLAGRTHAARVGVSLTHAVGMGWMAATTPDEYVRIAAEMGRDVGRIAGLRRTMRERLLASPLLDAAGFAARLECAYRQMWRSWAR